MRITLLLLLTLQFTFAQKLALVIGNSNYTKGYLANPINDAKLIAQTLQNVGFVVTSKTDLKSKSAMENAINSFAQNVSSHDTVAVYYSGHGVQYNGSDYLMPTHANVAKKGQLPSASVDVNFLLGGVSDAKLAIVMLDACRNNPYRSFVKGIPKGLGQASVSAEGGMIVSYATEANQIANDGNGANSPYALALAKYMQTSLPVETVFKKVRREVKRLTHKEQKPMTKMMFDGDFVFVAKYIPPTPQPTSTHSMKGITIVDGLMYQNQPFSKKYTWEEAKKYCKELMLGNYTWQLPTRAELNKLSNIKMYGKHNSNWKKWFDENKHRRLKNSKGEEHFIDKKFIENMPSISWFWTRETYREDSSWAWAVGFSNGDNLWDYTTDMLSVLCVNKQ